MPPLLADEYPDAQIELMSGGPKLIDWSKTYLSLNVISKIEQP